MHFTHHCIAVMYHRRAVINKYNIDLANDRVSSQFFFIARCHLANLSVRKANIKAAARAEDCLAMKFCRAAKIHWGK